MKMFVLKENPMNKPCDETHGACQEMLEKYGGKTTCCHCLPMEKGHKCKARAEPICHCPICNGYTSHPIKPQSWESKLMAVLYDIERGDKKVVDVLPHLIPAIRKQVRENTGDEILKLLEEGFKSSRTCCGQTTNTVLDGLKQKIEDLWNSKRTNSGSRYRQTWLLITINLRWELGITRAVKLRRA